MHRRRSNSGMDMRRQVYAILIVAILIAPIMPIETASPVWPAGLTCQSCLEGRLSWMRILHMICSS